MSETTREQLEAELVALRSQNAAQAGVPVPSTVRPADS